MNREEILAFFVALVSIPAYSREEKHKADFLESFMNQHGMETERFANNILSEGLQKSGRPVLVLNSHLDTVRPNAAYSFPAHQVHVKEDKIYGLGTNDAGASLLALLLAFIQLRNEESLNCNLKFLASAEEEISGAGGISSVLAHLNADAFIVGEPTGMNLVTAEKGLMVVDLISRGRAGHAAHSNSDNAILNACEDIAKLSQLGLDLHSELLGKVKLTPSVIKAGQAHNMVPDLCEWTLDIRSNECYSHEQIEEVLKQKLKSEVRVRSSRLRPTFTDKDHFLVKAGLLCGMEPKSSSTLSDQALIPVPSVKIGPGDTHRSHIADEYVYIEELFQGIEEYKKLIKTIR